MRVTETSGCFQATTIVCMHFMQDFYSQVLQLSSPDFFIENLERVFFVWNKNGHYGFAYFAHNVGGGDEIELTNNLNMSVPNSVSFAYWGWDWLLTRIRGGES